MMSPDDFYSQLGQINVPSPSPQITPFGPNNQPAAGQPPQRPVAPVQRPVAPPQAAAPVLKQQSLKPPPSSLVPTEEEAAVSHAAISDELSRMKKQKSLEDNIESDKTKYSQTIEQNSALDAEAYKGLSQSFVFNEAKPQYQEFASKSTPWLMMLTAIGGKIGKISGMGMLKAQTGMLKGLNEGQKVAYDRAYQEWKDHYDMAKGQNDNAKAVLEMGIRARKGQADAQRASYEMAVDAAGYNRDAIKSDAALIAANDKTALGLEKAKIDIDRANLSLQGSFLRASQQNSKLLNTGYQKVEASQRLTSSAQRLQNAWNRLDAKIKSDPTLADAIKYGTIGDSKTMDRINMVASDEYADFKNASASITGPFLRETLQGIPATALRGVKIEYKEMESMPDITKGYNFAKDAVAAVTEMANQSSTHNVAQYNDMYTRVQSGQSPFGMAPQPTMVESKPATKSYTQQDLDDTISAHPEMTREQIVSALKAQGLTGPQ